MYCACAHKLLYYVYVQMYTCTTQLCMCTCMCKQVHTHIVVHVWDILLVNHLKTEITSYLSLYYKLMVLLNLLLCMRKGFSQSTHVIITMYCTCTGLKAVLVHVHKRQLIKMLYLNVCVKAITLVWGLQPTQLFVTFTKLEMFVCTYVIYLHARRHYGTSVRHMHRCVMCINWFSPGGSVASLTNYIIHRRMQSTSVRHMCRSVTHIVSGCEMLDNCSLGGLTLLGNSFDLCPALSVQRCDPCFLCVPAFLVCCMLVCVCLCGYYSNTSHLYIKCFPTYLPYFILLPGPQTNEFIVMA